MRYQHLPRPQVLLFIALLLVDPAAGQVAKLSSEQGPTSASAPLVSHPPAPLRMPGERARIVTTYRKSQLKP